MNPKQFMLIGGAIRVILGVVGFLPIITEQNNPWFQLDSGENIGHIGLGVVALAAWYFLKDASAQKWLVAVVGVVGMSSACWVSSCPRRRDAP